MVKQSSFNQPRKGLSFSDYPSVGFDLGSDLAHSCPFVSWLAHADGRIHSMSERWSELTGNVTARALDHQWALFLHVDDLHTVWDGWVDAIEKKVGFSAYVRLRLKDKTYEWHLFQASPTFEESGEISGYAGGFANVHELKAAKQDLSKNAEALSKGLHISSEAHDLLGAGVFEYDCKLRCFSWDRKLFRLFGFTYSPELDGMNVAWCDVVHPDDLVLVQSSFEELLERVSDLNISFRILKQDKTIVKVRCRARLSTINENKVIGMIWIEDLSFEDFGNIALVKTALNYAKDAIGVLGSYPECKVEYLNAVFENISGYPIAECLGKSVWDFYDKSMSAHDVALIRASLVNGKAIYMDVVRQKKDGSRKNVQLDITPANFSLDGKVMNWVVVSHDITQRAEQTSALAQNCNTARALLAVNQQLLHQVVEESRSGLHAILGELPSASGLGHVTKPILLAQNIADSGKSLLASWDDVENLVAIERGEFALVTSRFSPVTLLSVLKKSHKHQCVAKNISFTGLIDPSLSFFVFGDYVRLYKILDALIASALLYTEIGGVTVEINAVNTLVEPGDNRLVLRFKVSDTGVGIPSEVQSNLIGHLDHGFSGAEGIWLGSGMRLTLINSILHLMGSELKLESSVDSGSCFSFDLAVVKV